MIDNYPEYKYENPYKVPFVIKRCWTNGTVTLQCHAIKIRYNTRHTNPYTYDRNVKDINPETND